MAAEDESPIPLLDLGAQNRPLFGELREAFERVLESGRFILGPEVEAFEQSVAQAIGAPHAIGVSSGTDALLVSLMAHGIGPGDEVITTPFSFFATAGCISRVGARPVFADIEPGSFNLDPALARACITERTRAILPVHLFGQLADMPAFAELAERHGLVLIEDAAQAIGATSGSERVGDRGHLACYSFFPSKNLGGFGDAGLVTARDESLAHRVRILCTHGAEPKYHHALVGGNFRLDALAAALLRVKLPHLGTYVEKRRDYAALYDALFASSGLTDDVLSPPPRRTDGHVFNQYVIRTPRRDALRDHLRSRGIGTEIYYPKPLHLQVCFRELGYREGHFPKAEAAAREVLALPVFPELGRERVERVAREVIEFLKS